MTLGKMLKLKLIENDLSVKGLAQATGVSANYIYGLTSGREALSVRVAALIGQELGYDTGAELLVMQRLERADAESKEYNKLFKEQGL